MIPSNPGFAGVGGRSMALSRVSWIASVAFCAVLPAVTLLTLFVTTIQDHAVAFDFRPFYSAAGAVLEGETPYPEHDDPLTAQSGAYVYPPLTALLTVPLRALPVDAAGIVMMLVLALAAAAIPLVVGVRDWRCSGIVFLWPPVLSAIQTGNVTLLLGLAAAVVWRFRERTLVSSVATGVTLATKFFLWPLVVWLAATRRMSAAALSCVFGVALTAGSWAAIGFAGLGDYPDLMRRLEDSIGLDSYTAYVVGLDLGLPSTVARLLWLVLGLGLLAVTVVLARRGDERGAFILAMSAALALTPIVWLHYFALLVVVVAVGQPRLGVAWFVPLAMVITPGSGHPTALETSATLAIAALTIALALRASNAAFAERSVATPTHSLETA